MSKTRKEIHDKKMKSGMWDYLMINFTFWIGCGLILGGILTFMIGFHDVDLSWNMLYRSYHEQSNYLNEVYDLNSDGVVRSYLDGYGRGMMNMMAGLLYSMAGVFLFTGALSSDPEKAQYYMKHRT